MRYLKKYTDTTLPMLGLSYDRQSDRPKIRAKLLMEQKGFCAYSERFIRHTDETHIEHFDPRLKETLQDDYYNWYAVLPWFNSHKPKQIEPFLPILSPNSPDLFNRIAYQKGVGIFQPVNFEDVEAKNLVHFLKWDSFELYQDCQKHIQRIRDLFELCGDEFLFRSKLISDKDNLSFATALKAELGIDVEELLEGKN